MIKTGHLSYSNFIIYVDSRAVIELLVAHLIKLEDFKSCMESLHCISQDSIHIIVFRATVA